jgi:uncharacterized membrane protein
VTFAARRTPGADALPGSDRLARTGPTHPRWTHVPLGGVLLVAAFDVVSVAGGSRPWARELYRAGTFVLMVGSAAMVVAIATGLVDRTRAVDPRIRGRVNLHAVLMSLVAGAAVLDLALRRAVHPDAQRTPGIVLAITLLAMALSLVGGALGGRLTYRLGVGVRSQRQGPET